MDSERYHLNKKWQELKLPEQRQRVHYEITISVKAIRAGTVEFTRSSKLSSGSKPKLASETSAKVLSLLQRNRKHSSKLGVEIPFTEHKCVLCGSQSGDSKSGFSSSPLLPMCSICDDRFQTARREGEVNYFNFPDWVLEQQDGIASGRIVLAKKLTRKVRKTTRGAATKSVTRPKAVLKLWD